jgi:hypothetical protein
VRSDQYRPVSKELFDEFRLSDAPSSVNHNDGRRFLGIDLLKPAPVGHSTDKMGILPHHAIFHDPPWLIATWNSTISHDTARQAWLIDPSHKQAEEQGRPDFRSGLGDQACYDRRVIRFLAFIHLAAAMLWKR